jgi:glycosyltransferase involved in cell wall biosynthesis
MIIGLDGSRAFLRQRTGIEEYSYQVTKHLINELRNDQVVLYIRKNQKIDFALPDNWKVKIINWPYLWTQIGLSLEMLFHPVDVLFIPAHIVPIIHAKNTVVVIHGLEYEFVPEAYPLWERIYMRWAIKNSCRRAKTIIAVSNNTKKDLMRLYNIKEEKINVIYEGYNRNFEFRISNFESNLNELISKPYLLFVGRLEVRKNIVGILEAYKILIEKYKLPHALVLAGTPGHGYGVIKLKIKSANWRTKFKIIELGYVSNEKKQQLFANADVFLFPTLYEGFGLPILEAQNAGVPVVASNNSSIPEVVQFPRAKLLEFQELSSRSDFSALLVDPQNSTEISEAVFRLISDKNLRDDMIKKGLENTKRFSWDKCASSIAELIKN